MSRALHLAWILNNRIDSLITVPYIVRTQYKAGYHEVLFITEDDRLLSRLEDLKDSVTLVFPNADNLADMIDYGDHVLKRSGREWYERVIVPELRTLAYRIQTYKENGWDVRLTSSTQPYIEDVVELPGGFVLPYGKGRVFLNNVKVVAFDFDDTLAVHILPDYADHREDDFFLKAHQNPESFYDDMEPCVANKPLQNVVQYCRDNGIPMYCISKMRFTLHMQAKENFLRTHYSGDDIDFISVSSNEIKNDVLKILCKKHGCSRSKMSQGQEALALWR